MSRWRRLQKELMARAMRGEKLDVRERDVQAGRVHGTIYFKPQNSRSRGVLLVGGISGNRRSLSVLAQRLVEMGYFCLSIDLPSHYKNTSRFSVGEMSEEITQAIGIMRGSYGVRRVAVIGHSLGAIGALLSSAGYNRQIEERLHLLWNGIVEMAERKLPSSREDRVQLARKIDESYSEMKRLVLESLKSGIRSTSAVSCYVFLAPPKNMKKVFPGTRELKKMNRKTRDWLIRKLFHEPAEEQIYREGNPVGYRPADDGNPRWQFLTAPDSLEFIEYFSKVREAPDFLKLVEDLSKFRADGKVTLFQYYQRRYVLQKPKLFVYGSNDFLLLGVLAPLRKRDRKLEEFYESCGNAEIFHGKFNHLMTENPSQRLSALAVTNERVTEKIMNFVDGHM